MENLKIFIFNLTTAPGLLGCNFETDICSLIQSNTDTFNWTRVQGYTQTKGSGPSSDHTYGKGSFLKINFLIFELYFLLALIEMVFLFC